MVSRPGKDECIISNFWYFTFFSTELNWKLVRLNWIILGRLINTGYVLIL